MTPGKVGEQNDEDDKDFSADQEDIEVLRDAGVLPSSSSRTKGKGKRKSVEGKRKHVVFVSNPGNGVYNLLL